MPTPLPQPGVGARRSPGRAAGEVLLAVGVAALGVWLGLSLFGGLGRAVTWQAVLAATLALLAVEVALRPVLRLLAGRGSAGVAIVLGVLAQVYVAGQTLYLTTGLELGDWPRILLVLATAALVITLGRWLVGASDAAYVIGHATQLRRPRLGHEAGGSSPQGLVVVQLDGLSAPVLRRALAAGQVPTLARWLGEGSHLLHEWWAPVPSTTPASQAAVLYGDDRQVPGFRWWDRRAGRLVVSNRPADAALVEARLPAERGLLRQGGVAVSTAFSGAADRTFLVFSTAVRRRGLGPGDAFVPLFASPFLLPRTLLLTLGEMVKEAYQARRQRARDVRPRIPRRVQYIALRGLTNVLLRTLNLVIVADQMSRGAPIVFVDFVDYDEIAHHAGPERPEAMRALEGLDAVLAELELVAERVPTDYRIVVWSDHGQSLGTTFEQLSGDPLAARVRELMADDAVRLLESTGGDEWGPLNALIAASIGATARRPDSYVLGPDRDRPGDAQERPDLVVVGGGNLGMVWFPRLEARPTLVEVDRRWPGLVPGLALTAGVGAVMVAVGPGEAVAVGPAGTRRLGGPSDGAVEGSDPLAPYDVRGIEDLRRLTELEQCGDLVLLSAVDELGMVHAFESQVGSHGGLGGAQNEAILVHPAELELDEDLFAGSSGGGEPRPAGRGAVPIHAQLVRWRCRQGTLDG
jgi:hypothetical protein